MMAKVILMAGPVLAVIVFGGLVWRDARRTRREQAAAAAADKERRKNNGGKEVAG